MAIDKVVVDIITKSTKSQKSMLKYAAAAGAAALAVGAVIKIGKELVDAYGVQEQAEARLEAVIKSTGQAAGLTADELTTMASGLQDVTKYGDESIIGAQSLLLTFKDIGEETFPRALESILDISEAMGTGLKESTIQLGKALNDPIQGLTALRRVGIQFTDSQEELIKSLVESGDKAAAQNIILEEMESQFGGVARAAADTATGSFVQLSNSVGDLKEELGHSIADGLQPFAEATGVVVTKLVNWLDKNRGINEFIDNLAKGADNSKRSMGELQVVIDAGVEATKRMEKGFGDEYTQSLIDAGEEALTLVNNLKRNVAMEERYADAIAERDQEKADSIAKEIKANDLAIQASEELIQLQIDGMSADEKELARLQDKVNYWDKYRGEIEGAEEAFQLYAAQRNELSDKIIASQEEETESNEELLNAVINVSDATALAHAEGMIGIGRQAAAVKELKEGYVELTETQENMLLVAQEVSSALSSFSDLAVLGNENEIASIDAQIAAAKKKGENTDKLEARKKELLEENWRREKAFSTAQAIINTAVAITKALTGALPPWNFILAGLSAAAGAAEIAVIQGQAMPAFETGGTFIADQPQLIQVGEGAGSERVTVEQTGGSSGGNDSMILNIDGEQFNGWLQNKINNGNIRIPRRNII